MIEQFVEGKDSNLRTCEDVVAVTADFAAVIDGATDKLGVDFDGRTGGLFAAEAVRDALLGLDREAGIADFVRDATALLAERVTSASDDLDLSTDDGPSASFVAYSDARREVWRVGDCSWMSEAGAFLGAKKIDSICAGARSALLRALIEQGVDQDELLSEDPGREMIRPLLRSQHVFRNLPDPSSDLSFGAIDGREVPDRFLEVWPVGEVAEVILASDGYPELNPTLALTEEALEYELTRDPLRIATHPSTKGARPGGGSFDDRAYLRLST